MNKYIKSPLNYVGGKHKLLPQIIPYFPTEIDTFIDLLGGGFNVGINSKANTVIYNDINEKVVSILKYLNDNDTDVCLSEIDAYINQYNLSKTNKEGYIKFRSDYNENPNPIMLYTLICYAFNYQIRYNSKGEFNMPFGETAVVLIPYSEKNLRHFVMLFILEIVNLQIFRMNVSTFMMEMKNIVGLLCSLCQIKKK